jgi:hypothetical protein
MDTQTPIPDADLANLRTEVAVLRTAAEADLDTLESRLTQLIERSESRQELAMEKMGSSLREEMIALRVRVDALVATLATKADLLDLRSSMQTWFLTVAVTPFVACGGASFALYRLAIHPWVM